MRLRKILAISALFLLLVAPGCGALPSFAPTSTPQPPQLPTLTPAPTETLIPTPVTPSRTPVPTPSRVPSATPKPTKALVPAAAGTPVFDSGFLPIEMDNVPRLVPAFQALKAEIRQAAASQDGQKLFVSTSNGMFVYDRQGSVVAHWDNIFTFKLDCRSCLAVNRDGSRFALLTRNGGHWEVQVYDVAGAAATKLLVIPLEAAFLNRADEGQVTLSPGGEFLAYSVGATPLNVFSLKTGLQIYSDKRPLSNITFTPDSRNFVARLRRELLFFKPDGWDKPTSLLLPTEDTPHLFSPDGKYLVIALSNRLRIYNTEDLKNAGEIPAPDLVLRNTDWQFAFLDNTTLRAYGLRWNGTHTQAKTTLLEWNLETRETTRSEKAETDAPSPLSVIWGADLPLAASIGEIETGEYNNFRFIGDGMILVNSQHSVCWLKIVTAEQVCQKDPDHVLFSSDAMAFKEVLGEYRTTLESWNGGTVLDVSTYRIVMINRTGDWVLINIKGLGTDLYAKNKTFPEESVGGAFQAYAESPNLLAFTTQQKSKKYVITVVEKASGKTLAQKQDVFLYQPMAVGRDGSVYLLKRDLDKGLIIVNVLKPEFYNAKELARLPFPAEPTTMAFASMDKFLAFGLADGSVVITPPDASATVSFQAFDSPIAAIAFSPDGRYLAVASAEGVKIFVVRP